MAYIYHIYLRIFLRANDELTKSDFEEQIQVIIWSRHC